MPVESNEKQAPHWLVPVALTAIIGPLALYAFTSHQAAHAKRQEEATHFYAVANNMLHDANASDRAAFTRDAAEFQALLNSGQYKHYLNLDGPSKNNLDLLLTVVSFRLSYIHYADQRERDQLQIAAQATDRESTGVRKPSEYIGASYDIQAALRDELDALTSALEREGFN